MSPFKAYLIEQNHGKVVSHLGFQESAWPNTGDLAIQGLVRTVGARVQYGE